MRRFVAVGAIRVLGLVVAVIAGAAGVVYAVATVAGSTAWIAGPTGSGGLAELPLPLRIAYAVSTLLGAASVAAVALVVSRLAWRVRRETAFVPALTRSMWAIAGIVVVGPWLTRIAGAVAAHSGRDYGDGDPTTMPDAPIHWTIGLDTFAPDLPLLGLGIVLGLCAFIVGSAERLQRDTEGLI
jgi:hypothetical protein